MAVGSVISTAGTLATQAEAWDGASWTIQNTLNPSGFRSAQLNGVSCTSETACTAVGVFTDHADGQQALAERWNGT